MPVFTSSDPERSYKRCIRAARFRVKWKDIFNVKEFYRAMRYWFMENDWKDMEEGSEHYETLYYERIGLFGDKEMWWRWRPQKILNNYFRYHIDLDYHLLYLVPTEVVRDGKKFKKDIYKGEVEIWITAVVETDWQDQWRTHPFLKYFNSLFRERIFRRQIYDEHKRELYREAFILQNFIKQWFKLKRYLPYEEVELFHSPKSYPSHSGAEQSV
jgi:hypothetical protein